jgi:hypoxanthine phosphoribosyltransferase
LLLLDVKKLLDQWIFYPSKKIEKVSKSKKIDLKEDFIMKIMLNVLHWYFEFENEKFELKEHNILLFMTNITKFYAYIIIIDSLSIE